MIILVSDDCKVNKNRNGYININNILERPIYDIISTINDYRSRSLANGTTILLAISPQTNEMVLGAISALCDFIIGFEKELFLYEYIIRKIVKK